MNPSIAHRLRSALRLVFKGSIAPFDRIPLIDGAGRNNVALDRPMEQSAWVMRAIKRIAEPISAVPLEFYEPGPDGAEIDDPRLIAFWQAPVLGPDGQRIAREDVYEAAVGWLKLAGEIFFVFSDAPKPFPDVVEAFAPVVMARPDCMREIVGGAKLQGWLYTDTLGRRETLLPEQVLQVKFWSPYNVWRGLPEYEAARLAAETDRAEAAFFRSVAEANGDQGAWVISKTPLDDPQRKQIEAQLREKRERAQRGDYRTGFLTGDIAIEDPKTKAPDAALVAQRLQNRHEIAIAFGVPPSLFDLVASYSIGSASDQYVLIVNTCQPTARKINAAFATIASRQIGRPVEAVSDWDDHPVMQAVRRERVDTGMKLWGAGMPMEKISEYLDMGLPEFPGWDVGYLPFSVAPVSASEAAPGDGPTVDPAQDPALAEPSGEMKALIASVALALRARSASANASPDSAQPSREMEIDRLFACRHDVCEGATKWAGVTKARDPRELARWRSLMLDRRKSLRDYQRKISAALFDARRETLQKIEAADSQISNLKSAPAQRAGAAADFTFSLEKFRSGLFVRLRNAARAALDLAGQQVFSEVKRDDPWSTPPEEVVRFVRERQNRLAGATDDIWEKIRSEIDAGLQSGEGTAKIADRVRAAFNGIDEGRAQTIAQTEVAAAYGTGRANAMKSAGVRYKAWLTSGNDNVRAAHAQAGLDYPAERGIPLDDPFFVDGEALMHPGDPQGSPGNVINCHCVSIAVAPPEEEST